MTERKDNGELFWNELRDLRREFVRIDGALAPEPYAGLQWAHPLSGKIFASVPYADKFIWNELPPYVPEPPTTNKNGNAGKWSIKVSTGGYPVWCRLFYEGKQIAYGIHHKDLRDLQYTINRAILAARDALPETYKDEMD